LIEYLTAEYDLGRSLTVGLILFFSTTVVRVAGFGGSLTAMPLISPILGLGVASPLMNLFGVTNFTTLVIQKWREFTFTDMWRLAVMNILFTPVGIWTLSLVEESVLRFTLGVVCAGYSLMRLAKVPPPALKNPNWAWVYGFFSGVFTGAFSVGGVPAVLYADSQDWEPERFRTNMFSFFSITSGINMVTRYFAGQFTWEVVFLWLTALPFMFSGLWVGEKLTRFVDKQRFQKLVLLMLVVLGVRLIYSAI
jgi:uncharacterized membrane protein YfcA